MSDAIATSGRPIRRGSARGLGRVESTDSPRAEARPIAATIGATTGHGAVVQWVSSDRRCREVTANRGKAAGSRAAKAAEFHTTPPLEGQHTTSDSSSRPPARVLYLRKNN